MNLPKDFENRVFELFTSEEMSEPLIMVYKHLSLGVHLRSERLILTPNELRFVIDDHDIWKFPMLYGSHSVYDYYKDCLLKVFERDPVVQELFQYVYSSGGNLVITAR